MSAPTAAAMPIELIEFKHLNKGAAVGIARIKLGRALIVNDVMVLVSNGRTWANAPSKPQVGRDGVALKDDRGKVKYVPILEWADRESRDRFSAAVIAAVEAKHGPIAGLIGVAP